MTKNSAQYNDSVDFAVDFTAPASLGAKQSRWCLYNSSNQCFYPFWIDIVIVAGAANPGVTPTR
jgi:hypothetical protein